MWPSGEEFLVGMLRFDLGLVVIKQDHAAEIAGRVRVEAFLQSSMQSQKLADKKVGSEASVFGDIELQIDHQVGSRAHSAVRAVGNNQGRRAQRFHLPQRFALRWVTAFGKQEDQQSFRSDDR